MTKERILADFIDLEAAARRDYDNKSELVKQELPLNRRQDGYWLRKALEEKDIKPVNWIETAIKPLSEAVGELLPGGEISVSGPAGVCCRATIHVEDPSGKLKKISLPFEPEFRSEDNRLQLYYRDFSAGSSKEYRPSSIGGYAGLNFPSVLIDESLTVREVVELLDPCALLRWSDNEQQDGLAEDNGSSMSV